MSGLTRVLAVVLASGLSASALAADDKPAAPAAKAEAPVAVRTTADIIAQAPTADWRLLDPARTLYLELATGRVVIELAPDYAPKHVDNIVALVREKYFDGLAIVRSQDNFVVQWGDPDAGTDKQRAIKNAKRTLAPEFSVATTSDFPFTALPDRDGYAPQVGFTRGMPAARDPKTARAWLAHCYAMVGVGRDTASDSGGGTELYVVTGHGPRQLDRNITVVGRVVQGMELLSTLPRGTGPLGFYEKPEQRVPIKSIRVAADVPASERVALEVMRTNTTSFSDLVEARRNRRDEWYKVPAGHIDLCNVLIPVRPVAAVPAK
jgi:peptidylprolyl isomerase